MNKNYIGENIRIYRERKNMTQRELADRIGKTWEMISRYERGMSSPLNQVDTIADALSVNVTDLLRDSTKDSNLYSFNRVPLFTSLPENFDFLNTKTYVYYTAPDWILNTDKECFVIDSNLVKSDTENLKRNGYLFISPNTPIKKNDTVLRVKDNEILLEEIKDLKSENIIGKVLAQEIIL